jgi:hypothetical protein
MSEGAAFGFVFWVRLGLVAIWVGLPTLLAVVLVWRKKARSGQLAGIGIGALVGVLAVWLAQLWLAPIAVVAGYLLGMLSGLRTAPPPTGLVRVASLQPRTVSRYVPRWAMLVAFIAAAVTIVAPAVLAVVPAAKYGPWHPFDGEPRITLPGATLAWPSAELWAPLAVAAAGALVVGALLIRRVMRLPQSGLPESTRRNAARTITGTVVGVELLALGALTLFTSSGLAVPGPVGGDAYIGSRILGWTGLGLAALGIVVWCVLSRWRRGAEVQA